MYIRVWRAGAGTLNSYGLVRAVGLQYFRHVWSCSRSRSAILPPCRGRVARKVFPTLCHSKVAILPPRVVLCMYSVFPPRHALVATIGVHYSRYAALVQACNISATPYSCSYAMFPPCHALVATIGLQYLRNVLLL